MKKIFIASDHAGYKLKNSIISKLKKVIDKFPKDELPKTLKKFLAYEP